MKNTEHHACCRSEPSPLPKEQKASAIYTCPMHPEIIQDHPGNCPTCGMDMVPVNFGKDLPDKTHHHHHTNLTQDKADMIIMPWETHQWVKWDMIIME